MNKTRRNTLAKIRARIDEMASLALDIHQLIDDARWEEQEYRDNMPEAFADGPKGEAADEAITAMEEAMSLLEEINEKGNEAVDALETAAA